MSRGLVGEKDDDELSGSENEDSLFDEDMEALRRACVLTGTDIAATSTSGRDASTDSDSDDDLQLVCNIQNRFSSFKQLTLLPLASDGEDDDFETLRAIQKRFSAFDHETLEKGRNGLSVNSQESNTPGSASEEDISNMAYLDKRDAPVFSASEDLSDSNYLLNNNKDSGPMGLIEWHQADADKPTVETSKYPSFPKCAQYFVDAIRKNRSCQKLYRKKELDKHCLRRRTLVSS